MDSIPSLSWGRLSNLHEAEPPREPVERFNTSIQLGDLFNLTFLDISGNELSGSIPLSLGNLSKLEQLNLSWNNLTDPIPFALSNLSGLSRLWLHQNKLSGSIPTLVG